MGQKVDPRIIQLNGRNTVWDSNYFQAIKKESSYFLYQDLIIRETLKNIFEKRGAVLNSCVIRRSSKTLVFFLRFHVTKNIGQKSLLLKRLRLLHSKKLLWRKKGQKSTLNLIINNKEKLKNSVLAKTINYKTSNFKLVHSLLDERKLETKLGRVLTKYTGVSQVSFRLRNTQNELIFKAINYSSYKVAVRQLGSYSRFPFYYEALELFVFLCEQAGGAEALANFIILKFKFMKKHNLFLTFLKRLIFAFSKIENSKWQGIKIVFCGRFNNAPRAKRRIIQHGCLPLQTLKSQLDYFQSPIYTQIGVFGLKVWISKKENFIT